MLTEFLRDLSSRPFCWGHTDCALAIADWLVWTGRNRDPGEDYRGAYDTERGCVAFLAAKGGLLRVIAREARALGLEPVRGDVPAGAIGVVRYRRAADRETHFGAIRTADGRWAIKCNDGLVMLRRVKAVAAWKVI